MKANSSYKMIVLTAVLLSLCGIQPATADSLSPANTILVNTTLDEYNTTPNDTCSLREAIQSANDDSAFGGCTTGLGTDTIQLQEGVHVYQISIPRVVYDNASGDMDITSDMVIQGVGPQFTIIDAGYQTITPSRIFNIDSDSNVSVSIQDLLIRNGNSGTEGGGAIISDETLLLDNVVIQDSHTDGSGGAVCVMGSTAMVTIQDTVFYGNISAGGGGAISAGISSLIIDNSTFLNNTAGDGAGDNGGAISAARVSISQSNFSGNSTYSDGGNLYLTAGWAPSLIEDSIFRSGHARHGHGGNLYTGPNASWAVTIRNTEISDGDAEGNGGGIANNLVLKLENVTISGNHAALLGGGIYTIGTDSDVDIKNSTIAYNTDDTTGQGDGIYSAAVGFMDYWNTLFAYNGYTGAPSGHGYDCGGTFDYPASHGYNLDRGDTCLPYGGSTGDLTFTVPLIESLADNGGPNQTHALLAGSQAIDHGNNGTCLSNDQRGWYRPLDGDENGTATCDIGAYEFPLFGFLPLLMK